MTVCVKQHQDITIHVFDSDSFGIYFNGSYVICYVSLYFFARPWIYASQEFKL